MFPKSGSAQNAWRQFYENITKIRVILIKTAINLRKVYKRNFKKNSEISIGVRNARNTIILVKSENNSRKTQGRKFDTSEFMKNTYKINLEKVCESSKEI